MKWFLTSRMMWAAGAVAAMSSITFPAVSALISRTADPDQQGRFSWSEVTYSLRPPAKACVSVGVGQGMVTGIRGLCNGLGPALYGFIFYIFHVELDQVPEKDPDIPHHHDPHQQVSYRTSLHLTELCWMMFMLFLGLF